VKTPARAALALALAAALAAPPARAGERAVPVPGAVGDALPPVGDGPAPAPAPAAERPRVEIGFVLDTTGSMGHLLETAKRRIWAIANEVARAKPSPEIRIGLVAFRDRGDAYVTRVHDLDADLDRVYGRLLEFRADGGGDGPESVNEALRAGVRSLGWTPGAKVLKVLFLVGDAPPHMDYAEDVPWSATCAEAAKAGIVINALRCGGDPETERVWTAVARAAEGVYASIPQEGPAPVATPFDAAIADLGARLGGTLVAWGDAGERKEAGRKVKDAESAAASGGLAAAPAAVAADRAVLLAKSGRLDAADLVADLAEGRVKLEEIPADRLPEEMRRLDAAGRKEFVEGKARERAAVKRELADLEEKRVAFLAEAARKAGGPGKSSFDLEVARALRAQAARKGLVFAE
jgi:hypothetical protein